MTINLTWFGHAAFLVETETIRVLFDPYRTPDVGTYRPIDIEADVVVVSHENPKYHSHWAAARGAPLHLNGLDFAGDPAGVEAAGAVFHAVPVFESPWRDVPVSMPYVTLESVTLCHSGDLGHALTVEEAAPIIGCDVFLAVAGGPPTILLPDLRDVIDLIQPKIVIPMHYQTGKVSLDLRPVDDIVSLFPPEQVVYQHSSRLSITHGTLPETTTLVVLDPAR